MSLYLKVLENENADTLNPQMTLALKEVYLPSLADNIKCGNSLIGTDFGAQEEMFDDSARMKINAFDWEAEFPEIFSPSTRGRSSDEVGTEGVGGFDCVIGNPPYGAEFDDSEKEYIREKFKSYQYKYDSYIYFIERALSITKRGGYLSYITPEVWLRLENCEGLRKLIFHDAGFSQLKLCGENVFQDAVVNTIVFVLQKGSDIEEILIHDDNETWYFGKSFWKSTSGFVIDYHIKPEFQKLFRKLNSKFVQPLENFGDSIQGITPYDKYAGQNASTIKNRLYHSKKKKNKTFGKWLAGKDVNRYQLNWSGEWLSYGPWLAAPREPRYFEGIRLLFREVPGAGKRIQATFAEEIFYHGHSLTPFKPNEESQTDIKYLLALSNSSLISWYGGKKLPNFGKDVFPKLNPQDIKQLPIRAIDFAKPEEKERHDDLVALVDKMLDLHKQLAKGNFDSEKEPIERQIKATDKKIDQLVYQLYGLTEEEIRVVEGEKG